MENFIRLFVYSFIVFDSIIHQWYTDAMDDRRRTLAAITVLIGFLVLVAVVVGAIVNSRKVISPVPEDNAIKIIFVSPTIIPIVTASPSAAVTGKVTPTKKPTLTPTP